MLYHVTTDKYICLRRVKDVAKKFFALAERYPWLQQGILIIALVVLFVAFEFLLKRLSQIDANAYSQPVLIVEICKRIGMNWLLLLAAVVGVLIRWGHLFVAWRQLQNGLLLRNFVCFLAVLMAWFFCSYGYNYYFAQGHYPDRLLLLMLLALLWWRPLFIFPFMLLCYTLMWQLKIPDLGGPILAHKMQVLHVLNLFAAFLILHALTGYRKTHLYIFITGCLVASAYWLPAVAKLQLDWLSHGHLYRMPIAAYAHGWLGFLTPEQVVEFAHIVRWFDWPMRIAVIVLEAGCLLFFWRRKLCMVLLTGVVIFHLGVFALYGFLFWTWILLDVALLVLIIKMPDSQKHTLYHPFYLAISIILIVSCSYWAKPPSLAWFDTRLNYSYRIEAVNTQGQRFDLPSSYFAPYDDVFTMAFFPYLSKEHNIIVGSYGVTKNRGIAEQLQPVISKDSVFEIESVSGVDVYNQERSDIFYKFLVKFISERNRRAEYVIDFSWFAPPRQFWSQRGNLEQATANSIRKILVKEVTQLYDDKQIRIIREQVLKELVIPQ